MGIPALDETVCDGCFSDCAALSNGTFETGSKLTELGRVQSFAGLFVYGCHLTRPSFDAEKPFLRVFELEAL
jgi:hypothetical protein